MKVIIAGSRSFNDYEALSRVCDQVLKNLTSVEVVSGGAKGADWLGELYATDKGYNIKKFPADWDSKGKRAGILRNIEMADYADALIAFWDTKSKGTEHMIKIATARGLQTAVYEY